MCVKLSVFFVLCCVSNVAEQKKVFKYTVIAFVRKLTCAREKTPHLNIKFCDYDYVFCANECLGVCVCHVCMNVNV